MQSLNDNYYYNTQTTIVVLSVLFLVLHLLYEKTYANVLSFAYFGAREVE